MYFYALASSYIEPANLSFFITNNYLLICQSYVFINYLIFHKNKNAYPNKIISQLFNSTM